MRGTMLRDGRIACDGKIIPERCASCWLQLKGIPLAVAGLFSALPENAALLARVPKLGPALAARALAAGRRKDLLNMFATADRVVAVCGWLHDALLANGASAGKLVLNRQGVGISASLAALRRKSRSWSAFRFGFLGRWDPVKGVHILVQAFSRLPASIPAELHILATAAGMDNRKYQDAIQRSAVGDPRIHFLTQSPTQEGADLLAGIDALLVPSQWLETGPLVVLEAFAGGKPVVGSDLGGIAELVRHERDGLLVPHDDVAAWTAAMARLATDSSLYERLCQGIGPVRTMADVAHDMVALYRELVAVNTCAA
jgi:glycosyltransferase involved in cell wall biosynthesis